jgi:Holliday junction DNA helicase RuvA
VIGSLRGMVVDRVAETELLVDVAGVGYRVAVSAATMARAGVLGDQIFLHVYTHVREDAIVLYGFTTADERACFEALIAAHGVGPSLALSILSVHAPDALRASVASDDLDALVLVPGVGRKTAARLMLELKARLGLVVVGAPQSPAGETTSPHAEVRQALGGLGYGPDEIRSALNSLPTEGKTEELLRAALRELAAAR